MYKLVILFLTFFLTLFTLISDNILLIGESNLVLLLLIIVLNYIDNKSITNLQIWLIGFIFIIVSEAILIESGYNVLKAIKFLFSANYLIIYGYYLPIKFKKYNKSMANVENNSVSKWTKYIIILALFIYIIYYLPATLRSFMYGRHGSPEDYIDDNNILISSLINSIGFILPSIIVYYYKEIKKKKSFIFPFLFSLPIFIMLFIGGTRFPLLFSFLGFVIMMLSNEKKKITLSFKFIALISLLILSSQLMMEFRNIGFSNLENVSNTNVSIVEKRISNRIASQMSPEGVIDMTALSMTYFETHSHTYGKTILFITYFWVPRSIWPNKPTMIGNWLIREFRSGFGSSHSASFGFTGELYADFGYFSLFFVFILGIVLRWSEQFKNYYLSKDKAFQKVLVAMIFSYVFFFVRSPMTSTINFIGILAIYFLFKQLLFKKM